MLQTQGPLSRAEVARRLSLSAPTVSKAVATLLRSGLVEESAVAEPTLGRPAVLLRPATQSAQVLGVVIDADCCQVVSAGLDGKLHDEFCAPFATPNTYESLIDQLTECAVAVMARPGVETLGVGVSLPGLIDYRQERGVLSPNVAITNGQSPSRDLCTRLGVECVMLQESHGLCLAERFYGNAQSLDDFAMLDVSVGVGLGVMSGGRLLQGHSGLAGEIGHIAVVENGRQCGCGNRGCLETVASDSALAWRVSRRLGRKIGADRVIELARSGKEDLSAELAETCHYLAVGVAAVINLFNPRTLFIHGRVFDADHRLFSRLVEQVRQRALPPSFADCRIVQAKGNKRQGAISGIIQHLTSSIGPSLESRSL